MSKHDDLLGTRKPPADLHKPTAKQIALVRQMARVGIAKPHIAREIGVGVETLTRHYGVVMEKAEAQALNKVLNALYRKALAGDEWAIGTFLFAKRKRHTWVADDWLQPKGGENAPPITLQFDAVGAISELLNGLKRDGSAAPVVIEHKEDED